MIAGSARGKKVNVSSEGEKLPVQLTQKVKECGDRAAIERCLPRDTKERIVTKHRIITRDRDRNRSCYVPELECERLSSDS